MSMIILDIIITHADKGGAVVIGMSMIILDIIITHADKGGAVVIMDVNDYIRHYHNACR